MLSMAVRTILEKAAMDNGFSIGEEASGDWLVWKAHAAPARLCMCAMEKGFGVGSDHAGAMRGLDQGLQELPGAPAGFSAVHVADGGRLNAVAGAIWRLTRSLPDEPLRRFEARLRDPAGPTEAERLRKERLGQDVFREALMLFWDGSCAVTGIQNPLMLRASHIIPWAECETDAERLNVYNGLLLAAHLDAAFDAHLISFGGDGRIVFSPRLSREDIASLSFSDEMRLRRVEAETGARLVFHRNKTIDV